MSVLVMISSEKRPLLRYSPSSFLSWVSMPRIRNWDGRRRSPSISSTFLPRCTRLMAMLAATVDLPSFSDTLLTTSTLLWCFSIWYSSLDTNLR